MASVLHPLTALESLRRARLTRGAVAASSTALFAGRARCRALTPSGGPLGGRAGWG
jgi:hypothetical protein